MLIPYAYMPYRFWSVIIVYNTYILHVYSLYMYSY